jgi:Ca2+-binding RTX toxin-like protein
MDLRSRACETDEGRPGGGDDSVQGGDGLGQRLQPLHLQPPVLDVVVEAISRADTFARTVFGPRSRAPSDDLIKGGLGADSVKGGTGADTMYGGDDTVVSYDTGLDVLVDCEMREALDRAR